MKFFIIIARKSPSDGSLVVLPPQCFDQRLSSKISRVEYTGWCSHNQPNDPPPEICQHCPDHIFTLAICITSDGKLSITMDSKFVHDDMVQVIGKFIEYRTLALARLGTAIVRLQEETDRFLQELETSIDPDDASCDMSIICLIAQNKQMIAIHRLEIKRLESITDIPFTQTVRQTTTTTAPEGQFTNFIQCVTSSGGVSDESYAVTIQREPIVSNFAISPVVANTSLNSASILSINIE